MLIQYRKIAQSHSSLYRALKLIFSLKFRTTGYSLLINLYKVGQFQLNSLCITHLTNTVGSLKAKRVIWLQIFHYFPPSPTDKTVSFYFCPGLCHIYEDKPSPLPKEILEVWISCSACSYLKPKVLVIKKDR